MAIRRVSQFMAQQPKFAFGMSPCLKGRRDFCAPAVESMRQPESMREALWKSKEFDKALKAEATKVNGDMTATGMYNWRVAAVNNALALRGKETGPLTVDDLTSLGHLDQYHYMGTEACDEAIEILGLDENATVLDIGSGIGGPARYLSMKSGCDITGVELQEDLNVAATDLTTRVGLQNQVRFVTGDFVERYQAQDADLRVRFDHVMSLLVILHVPDRLALLQAAYNCLKPGGTFLIEDFAMVGDHFLPQEASNLKNVVSAHTVTSKAAYIAELETAGFVDIEVVDLSAPWTQWTKARHESYRASKEETIKMHGEKLFTDRVKFYEVIDELFAGGNLGGVRITGRKMSLPEEKLLRGRSFSGDRHKDTAKTAVLNELGSTVRA